MYREHIEAYIGTHTCLYAHQCPHMNALLPLTSHTHVPPRACPMRWHPRQCLVETFSRRCHPEHPPSSTYSYVYVHMHVQLYVHMHSPVMWWRNLYAEGKEGSSRCCGHDNGGLCHMLNQLMVEIHFMAVPPFSQQVGTRSDWSLPRWSWQRWSQCSV